MLNWPELSLQPPKESVARRDSKTSANSALQMKGGGTQETHGETEGGLTVTTKSRSMRVNPFERPREGMAGFNAAGRYRGRCLERRDTL